MVFGPAPDAIAATPESIMGVAASAPFHGAPELGGLYIPDVAGENIQQSFLGSFGAGSVVRDLSTPAGNTPPDPVISSIPILGQVYQGARAAVNLFRPQQPSMTAAEYKASPYYRDDVPYDPGMTVDRAAALAQFSDTRRTRAFFAEGDGLQSNIGNFVGQALDPINYVPAFGEATAAAVAARFGTSFLGRMGASALLGASAAAINTAAFGVLTANLRGKLGDDVSWEAMLNEIGMSAVIGGAFGAVGSLAGAAVGAAARGAGRKAAAMQALDDLRTRDILSNAETAQAARGPINDAVGTLATDGRVDLSPNSIDVVQKMADDISNRRAADAELDHVTASIPDGAKTVTTSQGSKVEVRPEIVDAEHLTPAEGALQVRNRNGSIVSDAQIEQIAANLDPARLMPNGTADQGAPVVGPDGIVDSGNGRVQAIVRASQAYPEKYQAYKDALKAAGYEVPDTGTPILVQRRVTELSPEARAKFNLEANMPAVATLNPLERAIMDRAALDGGTMDAHVPEASLTSRKNDTFVQRFMANLGPNERSAMVDKNGRLNVEGKNRIENALMAKAFGDVDEAVVSKFTEATDDNTRAIVGAMSDVAPRWIRMRDAMKRGDIDPALDLTPSLTEAVRHLSRWREQAAAEGRAVSVVIREGMAQGDMLGGGISLEARAAIEAMYANNHFAQAIGREAFAARLNAMVDEVEALSGPQLFGKPEVGSLEVWRGAIKRGDEDGSGAVSTANGDEPRPQDTSDGGQSIEVGSGGDRSGAESGAEPGLDLAAAGDAGTDGSGTGNAGVPAEPQPDLRVAENAGREPDGSLKGLPRKIGNFFASAYPAGQRVAARYMAKAGLRYDPPNTYVKVDPVRAGRIATAFEAMKHDPANPEVKAAYAAMIKETLAQYDAMLADGMKIEFIPNGGADPYGGNPRNMTEDVRANKHMWVFPTDDGFGSGGAFEGNPLLAPTPHLISGRTALANDIFRAVHDYFGHVKEGVGFRADGEENAWRSHSAMYSPEARRAMTTETRGQNSWVNYGPFGEANRTAKSGETHYADQKIGLLPDWVVSDGAGDGRWSNGSIGTEMALRFQEAGRPADEAKAAGDLIDNFYTAQAKAQGITPEEMVARFGLPAVERGGDLSPAALMQDGAPIRKGTIAPGDLAFREADQNRLESVRSAFPAGEGYTPIVTIGRDGKHEILDGHNRAAVAAERGDDLPFVEISGREYDALSSAGFDDMEIAYAALSSAREYGAASDLNRQFPGAKVAERGTEAEGLIGDASAGPTSLAQAARDLTTTPEFKAWFGDSKVVDAKGKPLVVYHGTPDARDLGGPEGRFNPSNNFGDSYFFVNDRRIARTYAEDKQAWDYQSAEPGVLPAYLSIKNPLEVDAKGVFFGSDDMEQQDAMIARAKAAGHDGIIVHNTIDSYNVYDGRPASIYIAFEPTQIKSVANRGTFDPNDPRILFQPAYHGSPHLFDRFSTGKIGTGEGAQAYGHGLYFASRKAVAEHYRRALAGPAKGDTLLDGKPITAPKLLEAAIADRNGHASFWASPEVKTALRNHDENRLRAAVETEAADIRRRAQGQEETAAGLESGKVIAATYTPAEYRQRAAGFRKNADALEAFAKRVGMRVEQPGRLYHVDVPEPHELMDWDKPLAEQPLDVRAKLEGLLRQAEGADKLGMSLADFRKLPAEQRAMATPATLRPELLKLTGSDVYDELSMAMADPLRPAEDFRASRKERAVQASAALADTGIPGHQYIGHESQATNYVIYDDSRVNIRDFEQSSPDAGPRGAITFDDNGASTIHLFDHADPSTAVHEAGHHFLTMFKSMAEHPDAPAQMRDDWNAVKAWWGVNADAVAKDSAASGVTADDVRAVLATGTTGDRVKDLGVNVGLQEQWARAFESYLRDGVSPTEGLRRAFEQFKTWLASVYKSALSLNVKVTPEMRGVFDRMLGGTGSGPDRIAALKVGRPVDMKLVPAEEYAGTWNAFVLSQPERSLDELMAVAPAHQEALAEEAQKLADATGATFKNPGVKKAATTAQKMVRKGYDSTQRITDVVRGGFIVATPGQADEIAAGLAKRFKTVDEGWKMDAVGYFDRKVSVQFADGTIGEVQFWHPDMLKAKSGGGHKLYEEARVLPPNDPRGIVLHQQMRDIYRASMKDADEAWKPLISQLDREAGGGGASGNMRANTSGETGSPESNTSKGSTVRQPDVGEITAAAENPLSRSTMAGRPSQLKNSRVIDPNIGAKLDTSKPGPAVVDRSPARPDPTPEGLPEAEAAVGKAESMKAMADDLGVGLTDGDYLERPEIEQLRSQGGINAAGEEELRAADAAYTKAEAYGNAIKAAANCML